MNSNRTMRNPTLNLIIASLAGLILVSGCEKTYEPAAYKAAPRVDAGQLAANDNAAGAKVPDITEWTSPSAVRGMSGGNKLRGYSGLRGYRGIGGYRGIAGRGYAGMGRPYRGDAGQMRSYRGLDRMPGQYRGNVQQRNYRGRR